MTIGWDLVLDIGILSSLLLGALLLRIYVGALQKLLIPTSIVAGFAGFLLSDNVLGWVTIPRDRFGEYVYHLLAITFVAIGLRKPDNVRGSAVVRTGFTLVFGYGIQALLGLSLAFALMLTWRPDLFPTFGYFLLLGFGQGPGQAYALGRSWEAMGFTDAGALGLAFAGIGYFWACILGLVLVYKGRNAAAGRTIPAEVLRGVVTDRERQQTAGSLTTSSEALDGLALHLAVVMVVYLLTYGFLAMISQTLLADDGVRLIVQARHTLWGLHFIFAAFAALLVRLLLKHLGLGYLLDGDLLNRIAGTAIDFMVTAAIAAISIAVIVRYWDAVLIMTTAGGLTTFVFVRWFTYRVTLPYNSERTIGIFGTLTGTLSTGLALTRVTDPRFESGVAQELLLGCALAAPLTAPLMASILIPLASLDSPSPFLYYGATLVLIAGYLALLAFIWKIVHWQKSRIRVEKEEDI